jgi:hypothetical protein
VPKSKGRTERDSSAKGKAHKPNLKAFYRGELSDITPGDFEFELALLRGGRSKPLVLDNVVESFTWEDSEATLQGSVSLRRPDPADPASLPIGKGQLIRCSVRYGGHAWRELWRMRCDSPVPDPVEGTVTVDLADDMAALSKGERKWTFRKTKRRRHGWRCDEIARHVCKELHLHAGKLAKGTKRFDKVVVTGSGLAVLKDAYKRERDHSARAFVLRLRNGRVEAVPYQRNRVLYVIAEDLQTATQTIEQKDKPTTVIKARGHIGKGDDRKKLKATVFDRKVVARLGRLEKEHDYGRVKSRADLLHQARMDLAKEIRAKRTAELTIGGVPFIRRGDGLRWVTKEPGWYGKTTEVRDRSFVFCTAVSHTVGSGGEYTTTLSIDQDDPFVKDKERREKELRAKKRKARKARKKKAS